MKLINKIKKSFWPFLLLAPMWSQADVLINVTASVISPACDIRSENNTAPLKINFGTINPETLNDTTVIEDFSLYLSECDFNRNLAIIFSPKGSGSLMYKGKNILATGIDGLGVDFTDVTGGITRAIEVGKKQRISPQQVNSTLYRIDLKAQLVSAVPTKELKPGRFSSTVTLLVMYD